MSGKAWVAIIIAVMLLIGMIANSVDESSKSSSGKSYCAICGKTATTTFQGSPYCNKHYKQALDWVVDKTLEKDN